jgi:hypothetical protein
MFNFKLYTTFNLLFVLIFSFKKTYKQTIILFWIFNKFKEIIVFKDFEIDNGVLGLDRDVNLSIVKFLDSSILKSMNKYFLFLIFICVFCSILALVKNYIYEWNTFFSEGFLPLSRLTIPNPH